MPRCLAVCLLLCAAPAARADRLELFAGGDGPDGSPAKQARLVAPFAVDFAADGTTYIVEMDKGERLRAVTPAGVLVTLAGAEGQKGYTGDGGPGANARFNGLHHLAVGPDGLVYLADSFNNRVRTFDPKTGTVAAFAGTGEKGFAGDGGPALKAKFGGCYCVTFDAAGNGSRGVPKSGEPALSQPLADPRAHAVDAKGNLYILERGGHALRVVDPGGKIRTVAGTGKPGMGTGKALESAMNGPKHLCIDRDGSVLIADTENHRIVRYIPGEEKLVLVAGTGKKGAAGLGGDPLKAELAQPHGVAVHPKTGEIYIADSTNGRVLKMMRE